jgi:DNA polymerase III delta subunit
VDVVGYFLIGEDAASKDRFIARIKEASFLKGSESFNWASVYANEISDKQVLQEEFSRLPQGAERRVVLLRSMERVREPILEFLRAYIRSPFPHLTVIFEALQKTESLSAFLNASPSVKVVQFQKKYIPGTFDLQRAIEGKQPAAAVKVLGDLLERGQKPHFILGGIAHSVRKRRFSSHREAQEALARLLEADIAIKTGKIQPQFALERLVVTLCLLQGELKA